MLTVLLSLTGFMAVVDGTSGGDPAKAQEVDCAVSGRPLAGTVASEPQSGQSVVEALCSLRQLGIASVELEPHRRAFRISNISELERLRTLSKVTLTFAGKLVGGFTFANGQVTHKYFNPSPYLSSEVAVFKEVTTVSEVIGIAKEQMRLSRDVKFHEVLMPEQIALDQLDHAAIELASRSPEWRCGSEDRIRGQWGYTIKVRDGVVQHVEYSSTLTDLGLGDPRQ
jgi:hypothetical protein